MRTALVTFEFAVHNEAALIRHATGIYKKLGIELPEGGFDLAQAVIAAVEVVPYDTERPNDLLKIGLELTHETAIESSFNDEHRETCAHKQEMH